MSAELAQSPKEGGHTWVLSERDPEVSAMGPLLHWQERT